MSNNRDLFNLAKNYVMVMDLYTKARVNNEEFAEEMDNIRNEVLRKGYNIDKFVEFQNLYRELTVAEYYEFIKNFRLTRSDCIMNNNIDKPVMYIRKNREEEAIIYLKDNKQKAAQRLLCYMYATENRVKVLRTTTDIEDVNDCDIMLISSPIVLTRDTKEYHKIENKLKKKGIEIRIATNEDNISRYLDMIVKMSRKGF